MEMSLLEMFTKSGWVAKTVIVILLILSIYSISIMFEKFNSYKAARKESLEFLPAVTRCLKADKLQEAVDTSTRFKKAHIAKVMHAGLLEILNQRGSSAS